MIRRTAVAVSLIFVLGAAHGHITPPVVLVSDRDALATLLAGAPRLSVREVSLNEEERKTARSAYGWRLGDEVHEVYLGREADGKLRGAAVFMSEATLHGMIRVAVGIGADGKVKDARVVQVAEEIYAHLKPLIDRDFTARYRGMGLDSNFEAAAASPASGVDAMAQHYEGIVGRTVRRAVILYNLGIVKRGVA